MPKDKPATLEYSEHYSHEDLVARLEQLEAKITTVHALALYQLKSNPWAGSQAMVEHTAVLLEAHETLLEKCSYLTW